MCFDFFYRVGEFVWNCKSEEKKIKKCIIIKKKEVEFMPLLMLILKILGCSLIIYLLGIFIASIKKTITFSYNYWSCFSNWNKLVYQYNK